MGEVCLLVCKYADMAQRVWLLQRLCLGSEASLSYLGVEKKYQKRCLGELLLDWRSLSTTLSHLWNKSWQGTITKRTIYLSAYETIKRKKVQLRPLLFSFILSHKFWSPLTILTLRWRCLFQEHSLLHMLPQDSLRSCCHHWGCFTVALGESYKTPHSVKHEIFLVIINIYQLFWWEPSLQCHATDIKSSLLTAVNCLSRAIFVLNTTAFA